VVLEDHLGDPKAWSLPLRQSFGSRATCNLPQGKLTLCLRVSAFTYWVKIYFKITIGKDSKRRLPVRVTAFRVKKLVIFRRRHCWSATTSCRILSASLFVTRNVRIATTDKIRIQNTSFFFKNPPTLALFAPQNERISKL